MAYKEFSLSSNFALLETRDVRQDSPYIWQRQSFVQGQRKANNYTLICKFLHFPTMFKEVQEFTKGHEKSIAMANYRNTTFCPNYSHWMCKRSGFRILNNWNRYRYYCRRFRVLAWVEFQSRYIYV